MKCILQYDINGGYECGVYIEVVCFECDDEVEAYRKLEEAIEKNVREIDFYGQTLYLHDIEPNFFLGTLEDWFQAKITGEL